MSRLSLFIPATLLFQSVMCSAAGADMSRPNVIFVIADDLNDALEGYGGHPQAVSPNLSRLAETGTRFTHACCTTSICAPSRASLMTGIHAHISGNLWFDKWYKNEALANSYSLPSFFRKNGYHAAGSGKVSHDPLASEWSEWGTNPMYGPHAWDGTQRVGNPNIPGTFGVRGGKNDGGFGPLSEVPFGGTRGRGWVSAFGNDPPLWHYVSEDDRGLTPDEMNAQWAVEFLNSYPNRGIDKPFFLAVGLVRPHSPMHVPDRFFEMFPLAETQLPETQPNDMDDTGYPAVFPLEKQIYKRYYNNLITSYPTSEEGIKRFVQAYLASVAAMDENAGKIFDALERSPYRDNTIVVFTSDHGLHLGEKQYIYKLTLWEESARIPLIIRVPGVTPGGSKVEAPVSLIDLFPTLIDLCSLTGDTRRNSMGLPLDGHSFKPLLEDPVNGTWSGPDAALTFLYSGNWVKSNDQHSWSLRSTDFRYIRYRDGGEELYDHRTDPHEWTNLARHPDHADTVKRFRERLESQVPRDWLPTCRPPSTD